ncbi:glutathione S-transferase [Enhydrobacter aerosaccus]|uniref:Glutathione S-transferase n=1 Tax=Enhydrobacter aerosaccus TaxID=225324 RepID=A0A1T4S289_9HYPH|nr:glutathione S-transferase family protein [Enhydrobacter aerosaccus]SKA22048.1 glutathione S-transferase [Enhydrobacter aerosaccus]
MLKLYYAPGACSTASHIGLEESGAKYEAQALSFAKAEQKTPEYLKINPRGRVPALVVEEGTIVENTAILNYIAAKYAPQLMPKDPVQHARAISLMAWFSNTVHPAFTHINRPERFASDVSVHEALKATGRENFFAALKEIDGLLAGKQWIMGDQFTVVDGYALVFYGWGKRIGLPMQELQNYTRWKDRMLARPAVKRVVEREQSILLTP